MRVKTTKEVKKTKDSKGKMMVLKCDKKLKEENVKCEEQHKNEIIGAGNIGLRLTHRLHERRVRQVVKMVDSTRNLDECMQNECGEK